MHDDTLAQDLALLRTRKIFLGHQSVGADLVNGLAEIDSLVGNGKLHIVSLRDGDPPAGPYFAHSFVGTNGAPVEKCDAFAHFILTSLGDSVDAAMMKFCYADIRHDRDVRAMLSYYVRTMDDLKKLYPRVTFVHVTVPATERSAWFKRLVRSVLGQDDVWDLGATNRFEFNALLREQYEGDPFFDLAAVESTRPDGTVESFEYRGRPAVSLVSAYTYDGGHLTKAGRRVAARAMVRDLAAALRQREASGK
jgi:hypothetical protein